MTERNLKKAKVVLAGLYILGTAIMAAGEIIKVECRRAELKESVLRMIRKEEF